MSFLSPSKVLFWLLLVPFLGTHADFGDFADLSGNCPAETTCPVICEFVVEACSTQCTSGLTLCNDGSCRQSCPRGLVSPCPKCAPVACPKVLNNYMTCLSRYGYNYDAQEECFEQELLDHEQTYNAKPLSIAGLWLIGVTVCMFVWTRCVNRAGPPEKDQTTRFLDQSNGQTVTGYQAHMIGNILYVAVILTLIGFQILICIFTTFSYTRHQEESLIVFETIWSIGFVWSFMLKWPYSIRSIFYKRCKLHAADTVCVFSPASVPENLRSIKQQAQLEKVKNSPKDSQRDPIYISVLRHIAYTCSSAANFAMSTLFGMPARGNGKMDYITVRTDPVTGTRYFVYHFRRYNYDPEMESFQPGCMKVVNTLGDVVDAHEGLTTEEVQRRLRIVGPNTIEMQKPSALGCIYSEFSKPFYIYQLYMLWTWVPLYYYYLAVIHGSCIVTGGFTAAFFRFRNETNLFKLSHISGEIPCKRDGQLVMVQQCDLVPGDLVNVNEGLTYSDMVLVSTEGLLLDESALTGESTPMAKTAVDPTEREQQYSATLHKKHTIAAGTTVIEAEADHNLAIVLSTGSFTSKVELLREIFQYERASFAFDAEVPFVILILLVEAIIGFFVVTQMINEQPVYGWFYGMYVVSTLLPPLLPTVFTVSVGISDNRLGKQRIACSNSEEILVAGKVSKAFFDKTGTLTRQGLDFLSAKCTQTWDDDDGTQELSTDLVMGMSCCHHLTLSSKGHIIGNPVDRTMFDSSGATLVSSSGTIDRIADKNGNTVDILKHFDFDHHRMTQSVIGKRSDGTLVCFVKGSGESIQQLCDEETLPVDFTYVVKDSAKAGVYQISMGMKTLPNDTDLSTITRDEIEKDLSFIGVINFKNVLREETPKVIRRLESGDVQCIMVTGDSVLTGITIAKESGMIAAGTTILLCSHVNEDGTLRWIDESTEEEADLPSSDSLVLGASNIELAITGEVWGHLLENNPAEAAHLARAIRIYGRCTPFTKVSVVSAFVEMGFVTLMCGDGGNDCGALKTAHVGVALSDAEASIVSPFTSLDKSITSVVEILKEGRCALASAISSYSYIMIYGQIEAVNNVILGYFRINLSEYAWAFMDGIWMIGLGFTLPLAKAAKRLSPSRPTSSLLGAQTLTGVVGVLFINLAFTCLSYYILFHQDWFQCRMWDNHDISNLQVIGDNYEAEVLFIITGYQYVSSAMSYNFGYEFREGWTKNTYFVALAAASTVMHYWVTLVPGKLSCFWRLNCSNENVVWSFAAGKYVPIQNPFNTTIMPVEFRVILVILVSVNTVLNLAFNYYVINGIRKRALKKKQVGKVNLIPAKAKADGELAQPV